MMKRLILVVISVLALVIPTVSQADSSADASALSASSAYVGGQHQGQGQGQGQSLVNSPATNQNVNITQNTSIDPGQGRLFLNAPPLFQAPLLNYLGPWKDGANILESSVGLPDELTIDEAKNLYGGGVDSEVRLFGKTTATFEKCKLMTAIPASHKKIGYVFLKGSTKANTIDLLAVAYKTAMESGANAIVILKKQATTKASAWGIGIGTSAAAGILSGSEKDKSQVGSGGFGISYGSASPKYEDGMAVLMLHIK